MLHSQITDVCTTLLTGPSTNDPFLRAARPLRSAALIEIHFSDGTVGVGETYAGYFCPEVVPATVDFFRPILVGQAVDNIPELWQRLYHCGNYWCRVGVGLAVINGIEAALWDLRGKLEGKPVYELLGGAKHDSLPCYATGGPSNYPLDRLAAKIDHYLSLGFRGVKLGAGSYSPEDGFKGFSAPQQAANFEAEKLQFVRQRFGSDLQVMLDGHMGNSPFGVWDLETAQTVLAAVKPYDLFFFEEPLHYTNAEGYAKLCRNCKTPIAGGETLTGMTEWQWFIERDCFDIGQPDASFTGGLSTVLEVARSLAQKDKHIATHAWGAGASLMQNIHCGFAAENTCILEVPPDYGPLHSELIGESFRMENGRVLPPQTSGLGVQLTDDLKRRFPFVPGSGEFNSVPGKVLRN
jgi:L-alanine-DL-glutamate epimerase-like enolase superfamily enzyme